MQLHDIESFFRAYADAFNDLNGDAVAAHWATPCGISQGSEVTWWTAREDMLSNHRKLCDVYRAAGFAHCEPVLVDAQLLGGFDAFARVRWTITKLDGSVLQRFETGYHLKRLGGSLKVLLCTAFDEDLDDMRKGAE
jgi:hypothetical protein